METVHRPTHRERILGGLWGAVVGDALGVPVEFKDRTTLQADPVTGMRGQGTHHQPPGTWSDDGALLLCTVESLLHAEFDLDDMGRRFVDWMNRGLWTASGEVFDVGMATADALIRIAHGTPAEAAGGKGEYDNGNGSLMRILPVALRFSKASADRLFDCAGRASAITHAHARSQMSCQFYSLCARKILEGMPSLSALDAVRAEFQERHRGSPELAHFRRLLDRQLASVPEGLILSTGYVIHTLEAGLWCLLTTGTYSECLLKAVNLGGDTDTAGTVAGGLAGVLYGVNAIPADWRGTLARQQNLEELFERFASLIESQRDA